MMDLIFLPFKTEFRVLMANYNMEIRKITKNSCYLYHNAWPKKMCQAGINTYTLYKFQTKLVIFIIINIIIFMVVNP